MPTTTNLDTLKINYLTQEQYDTALENSQINENELYFTPYEEMGTATSSANGLMSSSDKSKLDGLPNIHVSTSDPTSSDGEDGDVWIKYSV